jgi:hypothetical protein
MADSQKTKARLGGFAREALDAGMNLFLTIRHPLSAIRFLFSPSLLTA